MLSIYATTNHLTQIRAVIEELAASPDLVKVYDFETSTINTATINLIIDERGIVFPLEWHQLEPPYLISPVKEFSNADLLAIILTKAGGNPPIDQVTAARLKHDLLCFSALKNNWAVDQKWLNQIQLNATKEATSYYRHLHNLVLCYYYGLYEEQLSLEELTKLFIDALEAAPNPEFKAYTARQLATLLMDAGRLNEAQEILLEHQELAISEDARAALQYERCGLLMQQLSPGTTEAQLATLKQELWSVLTFYENKGLKPQTGLLLVDASELANLSESYAESLGYISRAITIFKEEELTAFLGNASLRKGTLLLTWAKNGNPQFYRQAMETFQEALRLFPRDEAPEIFADIHHQLGVIYAELPDENKKRAVWAALSGTSFKEALSFYTKTEWPMEYATICNNYANAMANFPPSRRSDNMEKALELYNEALSIRSATRFPTERALTLINYLEACWKINNVNEQIESLRFQDMVQKANEVRNLVADERLLEQAELHLAKLQALEKSI